MEQEVIRRLVVPAQHPPTQRETAFEDARIASLATTRQLVVSWASSCSGEDGEWARQDGGEYSREGDTMASPATSQERGQGAATERAEASVSEVELQPRAGAAVSTSCVNIDLLPPSVFDLDLLPPHAPAHKKWFGAQVSFVLVGLRAVEEEEEVRKAGNLLVRAERLLRGDQLGQPLFDPALHLCTRARDKFVALRRVAEARQVFRV